MSGHETEYSPESTYFWEATKRGSLVLPYCVDCTRPHFYPRSICPFCHGSNLEWKASMGRGRVYSYTVAHYAKPPEVAAFITLDEGVTMLSSIVGPAHQEVKIGQEVIVDFVDRDGTVVPVFVLLNIQES